MRNYKTHAMIEFKAAGWLNDDGTFKDEMQKAMCEHVMRLMEVFSDEGHSGSSAPYAINLFSKLANFEPLVPLTGEDWEWIDHGYCMQNKRCGHVFKQPDRFDGQAYDSQAVIFWEWYTRDDGEKIQSHFTSRDSARPITFPYTPESRYEERV